MKVNLQEAIRVDLVCGFRAQRTKESETNVFKMVIKVYISGNSGNKEIVTHQQRIFMILNSLNIENAPVDIAGPGMDEARDFMRANGKKKKEGERNVLPPQIFNEEKYCGDYDDFDIANEDDLLEEFLGLPKKAPLDDPAAGGVNENDASKLSKEDENAKTEENEEESPEEKSDEVTIEPEEHSKEPKPTKPEEETVEEPSEPEVVDEQVEDTEEEQVPESIAESNDVQEEKKETDSVDDRNIIEEGDDDICDSNDTGESDENTSLSSQGDEETIEKQSERTLTGNQLVESKKKYRTHEVQEQLSFPKGCTKLQPYSSEAVG
ncbi:unnamed protein product [Lepeophtheirus salmonis]|uniref:(salmon louse) hypothetical protein n=1 Tax=Lepeophtheirus salmonis TaxID=72036 RepID=A0A7R8H0U7_LEPSM|nr:unnamed protein product [Lepeophtheirus salmonis]CAF2796280.1 unnamed protein product [Lepeophtheirus salmonis]